MQFTKLLDHSMVDMGEDIKKAHMVGFKKINKETVIRWERRDEICERETWRRVVVCRLFLWIM